MMNTQKTALIFALLSLSLLSGFFGYYLNQMIDTPSETGESMDYFREIRANMKARYIELKNNSDQEIEVYKNALKEAQREASDCRYVRTYTSKLYGFQISFPADDWCSPSPYNKEPSFYAESSCTEHPPLGKSCKGLRIIDRGKHSADKIDSTLEEIKGDRSITPVVLKNFIDGAITIKSQAPDPWGEQIYEYNIFFENSERQFYISAANKSLEPVIKTLLPLEEESISTQIKKTYSTSGEILFQTDNWDDYTTINATSNTAMVSLNYPNDWELNGTVFHDSNGTKMAELSPGLVLLKEGQHCFDSTFNSENQSELISKSDFRIGNNHGVKQVTKSYPEGPIRLWYPNSYCIEGKSYAFTINFYETSLGSKNQGNFKDIISSFKFTTDVK